MSNFMPKATVYNLAGEKVGVQELNPKIFSVKVKPELVQQVVVAHRANARNAIAHTKGRSEVRGGGKKPWRQKGTGRARHGSIRSPLWIGGGVTFGPTKERNFSLKINKKTKCKGLLMCLSDKAQNQNIILLDKLELSETKTKKAFAVLQNLKLRPVIANLKDKSQKIETKKAGNKIKSKKLKEKRILLVLPKSVDNVKKSFRNIYRLEIINANSLNVIDVLKSEYLLMPVESLEVIKKTFLKNNS